jgi:hypothetical protein
LGKEFIGVQSDASTVIKISSGTESGNIGMKIGTSGDLGTTYSRTAY